VHWLPSRLRGERDLPTWTALGFALALTIQPANVGAVRLAVLAVLLITILVARVFRLGWFGIGILLVAGIALRLGVPDHRASDVLDVTAFALRQAFLGVSPWGHGFNISRPPGAPLPYGPLGVFWYAPAPDDPRSVELFASCAILALLAVRGRPVGLAVYAMAPTLILTATDGSNDTSAGLLILGALVLGSRRPWLGAAVLAVAVAFKPYAAAWAPALLAYGGIPAVVAFATATVVVWAPSALSWGLDKYVVSLGLADATHHAPYWSLGVIWEEITQQAAPQLLLDRLRLVAGAVVALVSLPFARSIDFVILSGILVFSIVMFGGYWGTYAYVGAIAPIICWRLDDWLGIAAPAILARAPWAPPAGGVSSPG
jgi:hypothetical protein